MIFESKLKILIVEDDADDARLLKVMLEKAGVSDFTVTVAGNISSAIGSIEQENYDIIILDLNLPDSEGFSTLERVTGITEYLIPVIVLTGQLDEQKGVTAIEKGAEDYIVKGSISRHQLVKSIQYAIRRKKLQTEMRESEEKYRSFFNSTDDMAFLKDEESRYIMVNSRYEDFLGRNAADIKGLTDYDLFDKEFADLMFKGDKEALTSGSISVNDINYGGNVYEYRKFNIPMKGGCYGIGGYIRDITDKRKFEEERRRFTEELERSNAELQQFANVASHDLQEPLRMITGYLQLIKRRYMDKIETEGLEFIDYAIDGATRQQSLIESLMEYSRIGSSGLNLQPVDINEVISDITKDLKSLIEETGLSIEYKPLPVITADKMQIHRLFMNLIQNGAKFRTEGKVPRILISSETDNGFIIFRVSDNGIGIAEECFERIFQIFQRLHTREEYPGTGIGLAVCRKIVEKHGGRIWVESEQGKGTTFSFAISLYINMIRGNYEY